MKTIKQRFVIDESGSMSSQQDTIISGFNEQLESMRQEEKQKNVRYLVSLTKFANVAEVVFKDLPLDKVPQLTKETYVPNGYTALLDAIGKTIDTATPGETDVVVTIMTDGQENSSCVFKKVQIKTLIDIRQRENKWGFVYFGANQDAWSEASQLGVANAMTYTVSNTATAINYMSSVRCAYTDTATSGTYCVNNLTANLSKEDLVK